MVHFVRFAARTAVLAAAVCATPALAEDLPPFPSQDFAVGLDSGLVYAPSQADSPRVVYSDVVEVPDASWLRLRFGVVALAGDPGSNGAYLRITSMTDGAVQYLYAETLDQWAYTSAYFNGDTVVIDLLAYPRSGVSRVIVDSVSAGLPTYDQRSVCFDADDRLPSAEPANARLLPSGCTAFIFNDANRTMLTAGHCNVSASSVVQFNVPLSNADGTINHPLPEDQYPVEPSSVQLTNGGLGNDWAYFGAFPNSNTGLTPFQAQSTAYPLSPSVPAVAGQNVRITGYGTTTTPISRTWSQYQKSHVGPYASFAGTIVRYTVDTTGGNSGSPVLLEGTGQIIGIHTNAGCNISGGSNQGTAVNNSAFRSALATPRGICRSGIASPTGRIYIVGDLNNNFGAIAQESGSFGTVSQTGPSMQGLAYNPTTDRLLAIDTNWRLTSIDPATGASTTLGVVWGTSLTLNGLAFDPAFGRLYAISSSTGQLFIINLSSLQAIPIGVPQGNNVGGIDFDTSTGAIVGVDDASGGTRLVRINPATGVMSVVGFLGASITDCNGLAFDSDTRTLYTVNANNDALLQVNPATGAATVVGATNGLFGSSFGMAVRSGGNAGSCNVDVDGDGDVGTDADIESFFRILGGSMPGNADFNGDGDIGTDADIEAFFRMLAGGPCRF